MAFSLVSGQTASDILVAGFAFPSAPTAGGIVVAGLNWEGASGTTDGAISQDSGGPTFNVRTRQDGASGDHHGQLFDVFSGLTTTNGFTVTFPAGNSTVICAAEFACSDTPSFDTQNVGVGTSGTSFASGNISLDSGAAMWLVVAIATSYSSGHTFSNRQINGVNADGSVTSSDNRTTLFWRFVSSAFSNGNATCTGTVSDHWICNIAALKAGTGGATGKPRTGLTLIGVG